MEKIDQILFVFFNSTVSNDLFDWFFPLLTDLHKNSFFTNGVLPVLLVLWSYKQGIKALPVILGLIIAIGMVDNFTYRVLKPHFQRQRPPAVETQIQLRTQRYAGYSFPSNHAANNFAAAAFLSSCYPALSVPFYAVASLVAYSRVYVGVHYPSDIFVGALLGLTFGLFFFKFWVIIWIKLQQRWPKLKWPQQK